jgi:hypothetical protein
VNLTTQKYYDASPKELSHRTATKDMIYIFFFPTQAVVGISLPTPCLKGDRRLEFVVGKVPQEDFYF